MKAWGRSISIVIALADPAAGLALVRDTATTGAAPGDPIARLQRQIDSGKVKLEYDARRGYLPAVLKALGVSSSSQTLVFSKTSFQFKHISPRSPRALYFNDDAVVGWVPEGEVMEVAAVDPQQGAVFYVLRQEKSARPKFIRQKDECLQCHQGLATQGVPGHFMRSVYARVDGQPELKAGSYVTTDRSEFEERWGGWYVTGTHGRMRHMGNVFATRSDYPEQIDRDAGANVTDLSRFFDTSLYLQKTSDIVALMVAEHQGDTLNLITRAGRDTRKALEDTKPDDERERRIRDAVKPLVEALLFVRESPLKDRVEGSAAFRTEFQSRGPRDKQGRSLRDFDLNARLFRYPCSYLVYSRAFDALPTQAKEAVYRRLVEVLAGKEAAPTSAHLSAADRQAVLEILTETKTDFAAFRAQMVAGERN